MGRLREQNLDDPPHFHRKGRSWYHVTGTVPRKWTRLSSNKAEALVLYNEVEARTSKGKPVVPQTALLTREHRRMLAVLKRKLRCDAEEAMRRALEIAYAHHFPSL